MPVVNIAGGQGFGQESIENMLASSLFSYRSRPWRVKQSPGLFASAFLIPVWTLRHAKRLAEASLFACSWPSGTKLELYYSENTTFLRKILNTDSLATSTEVPLS